MKHYDNANVSKQALIKVKEEMMVSSANNLSDPFAKVIKIINTNVSFITMAATDRLELHALITIFKRYIIIKVFNIYVDIFWHHS